MSNEKPYTAGQLAEMSKNSVSDSEVVILFDGKYMSVRECFTMRKDNYGPTAFPYGALVLVPEIRKEPR